MSIAGILSQAQATDINLATSISQWLFNNVVTPYNSAAISVGINQGMAMQRDGTWKSDNLGLGIVAGAPDDQSIYERVPSIAYSLDYKVPKSPHSLGMGDGAFWEYRSVSICCLPAVSASADAADQSIQTSRQSQWLLKTAISNAITRSNILPIVDHSQAKVGGNYPQIGYAEILGQKIHSMEKIAQMLDANRLRFDAFFEIRWAVTTTN